MEDLNTKHLYSVSGSDDYLLHGYVASLQHGLVEILDTQICVLNSVHGHEGKPSGDACAGLDDQKASCNLHTNKEKKAKKKPSTGQASVPSGGIHRGGPQFRQI